MDKQGEMEAFVAKADSIMQCNMIGCEVHSNIINLVINEKKFIIIVQYPVILAEKSGRKSAHSFPLSLRSALLRLARHKRELCGTWLWVRSAVSQKYVV